MYELVDIQRYTISNSVRGGESAPSGVCGLFIDEGHEVKLGIKLVCFRTGV